MSSASTGTNDAVWPAQAAPTVVYPFDTVPPGRVFSALNRQRVPSDRYWPYRLAVSIGRSLLAMCVRVRILRPQAAERPGPYILAMTHLSHLDPFMCGLVVRRKVDFIASVGFFRFRWTAWFMQLMQAIAIKRSGVPVSAFRKAIAHLQRGRIVGICPEGGVAQGVNSAMRGATIKRGVCLLAQRTGAPILPAIMVGTDKLNSVLPWLPVGQSRLYVSFGRPIHPPGPEMDRRVARAHLAAELERAYVELFAELKQACRIDESFVP